jgi:hypothetical protein
MYYEGRWNENFLTDNPIHLLDANRTWLICLALLLGLFIGAVISVLIAIMSRTWIESELPRVETPTHSIRLRRCLMPFFIWGVRCNCAK